MPSAPLEKRLRRLGPVAPDPISKRVTLAQAGAHLPNAAKKAPTSKWGLGPMAPAAGGIGKAAQGIFLALLLVAAKAPPPTPPLPPLPPLILPADAPFITAMLDGQPLVLRVDPAVTATLALNAAAARRLGLANPARLVAGQPPETGKMIVMVGKVSVPEATTTAILEIAGRPIPANLSFGTADHIENADGAINPILLPHDEVRFTRRPATAADSVTVLPVSFRPDRGLIAPTRVGKRSIDVIIAPMARETIAAAAAAAFLAETYGGTLTGPPRDALISHNIARPVRTLTFARPALVAGFRLESVPARVFDWSGKTSIPSEALPSDEIIVRARFDGQRQWPKLAIGNDRLSTCAQIIWRRQPATLELICPLIPPP